ncbi:hypothetical protein DFH09DRAFT_1094056 [Mycena vulgaris]|nr:hypothetical protein DFH09DRAFT_1094056 [Mycena vulgaris]
MKSKAHLRQGSAHPRAIPKRFRNEIVRTSRPTGAAGTGNQHWSVHRKFYDTPHIDFPSSQGREVDITGNAAGERIRVERVQNGARARGERSVRWMSREGHGLGGKRKEGYAMWSGDAGRTYALFLPPPKTSVFFTPGVHRQATFRGDEFVSFTRRSNVRPSDAPSITANDLYEESLPPLPHSSVRQWNLPSRPVLVALQVRTPHPQYRSAAVLHHRTTTVPL